MPKGTDMAAQRAEPAGEPTRGAIDWEAFYRNYRKPGYVPGFEIVNKLGGGVFGMVFKARKESIGRLYAIKFLKVDEGHVREKKESPNHDCVGYSNHREGEKDPYCHSNEYH